MEKLKEIASRLTGRVIISSDISEEDLGEVDLESLIGHLISYFDGKELGILDRNTLYKIIEGMKKEKKPLEIEIERKVDFKPNAKEVEAEIKIRESPIERTAGTTDDFVAYLNDRFRRISEVISQNMASTGVANGKINSIEKLKEYANGREATIVGMVFDKRVTKNGNILVNLEDSTGIAKVIFMKNDERQDLYKSAKKIINDDIIAVKGKISGPFLIANFILWPEVPIHNRHRTKEDIAVGFVSDTHVGSKLFMEKKFGQMLKWLNGEIEYRKELAQKIKYIIIAGDLVDGIGIYPNQEKELVVPDIYKQYSMFFNFISSIPEYIHVFVLAGNHDAVQSTEPQPSLAKELAGEFKMSNVHLVTNPSYITLNGVKVLAYHGTSLDSVIQAIPGCSYAKPEIAMVELLKRRHLSPIYGGNKVLPTRKDSLVIDEIPDILHMGHIHKNGDTDYHGTLVLNSGTWQSRTTYQIKQGHIPSPAILPVYEMKSANLFNIDFNSIG
ncbi:MAG: DNA-directed DNA polymerase II small subunit [Candidatus Micrarchaeia archaeon]